MASLPGEPHVVRADLSGAQSTDVSPSGEAIIGLAHLTDLHVTDAQSPARFEFVNEKEGDPRYRELLTMQRPQEMLNTHAAAAMVRAINAVDACPVTGAPMQLVAVTGDGIDNAQANELANFLALLEGGTVRPDSGSPAYDGVQRADWPGDLYWKPDGSPDGDRYQRALGFPRRPGLLADAVQPFLSAGLRVPWLRCWGNHEQLCEGVGVVTPGLAEAMSGSRKAVAMPPGIEPEAALETFVNRPEAFLAGASREVAADRHRRPIERADLLPASCYVRDEGAVRFVALDTVCDAGGADGTVGAVQLEWLQQQLETAGGRYVIVLSHHGFDTLSNPRGPGRAAELLALLQRHRNVVLWLNGHIHANRITPRGTFWEVTTCSVVDWPCQARVVEMFRTNKGQLAIGTTVVDHDGAGLAGLHRELAGNAPGYGFNGRGPGTAADRNAILLLPDPLRRVA